MSRVAGKVVVVTGAARGQGAAEAAALAAEGATVIATDLADGPQELPDGRGAISYRRLDVAAPEDWHDLREYLARTHGRLDGLVNNAGTTHRARLGELAVDDLDRVVRINVTGPLIGIQTLLPVMAPGASIVNVGSLAALTAHYTAGYTISKWALRGLSRVACAELGPRGIRVNTIHPGYIDTPMVAAAPAAFRAANIAATPLGRVGTVEDVAPLVVFLISDESSFISGVEIPVDGGQYAGASAKALSDAVRPPQQEG